MARRLAGAWHESTSYEAGSECYFPLENVDARKATNKLDSRSFASMCHVHCLSVHGGSVLSKKR